MIVPALETRTKTEAAKGIIRVWQACLHGGPGGFSGFNNWNEQGYLMARQQAYNSALLLRQLVTPTEALSMIQCAAEGRKLSHNEARAYSYFKGRVLYGERTADNALLTLAWEHRLKETHACTDWTTECMIESGRTGRWMCPLSDDCPSWLTDRCNL